MSTGIGSAKLQPKPYHTKAMSVANKKIGLQLQRSLPVSASSGLVFLDGRFFVVADDENFLLSFSLEEKNDERKIILNDESLPLEPKARKKVKPDFECLIVINGSLLVVPSGSTLNRHRGYLVTEGSVLPVDFQFLFGGLRKKIDELNIEGGFFHDEHIYLFHRKNTISGANAMIKVKAQLPLSDRSIVWIRPVDLGPNIYGITDAAFIAEQKIWFTAVAENTLNAYDDGPFEGALLGCMNLNGEVKFTEPLEITVKPEGLCVPPQANYFYLVTDADDPSLPSLMYKGILPG